MTDADRRLVAELLSKAECTLHDARRAPDDEARKPYYEDAISLLDGVTDILRRYL